MQFHLYECVIKRDDLTVRGHIVAPSEDRAALAIIEHDGAQSLSHYDFWLERVDEKLPPDRRLGLDVLLRSAPVSWASYCDLGWIPHVAPIRKLRLFRSKDARGGDIYAVAPTMEVASALLATTLLPKAKPHIFIVSEGYAGLPEEMVTNLAQILEWGPVGIAEFEPDERRWFVW